MKACRATWDKSRARLLVTARLAASSPCQRAKPFGFETIDSGAYLGIAQNVLDIGEFARLVDGQVVPITDRMPAYVLLLASIIWLRTTCPGISPTGPNGFRDSHR